MYLRITVSILPYFEWSACWYVPDVKDLTVESRDYRVASHKLNSDGSPADIRCHREICDGCDHGDTGSDVVEEAVLAGLGVSKTKEDESGSSHGSADGPVEI